MNKGVIAGIVIALIVAVGLLVISQSNSSAPTATAPTDTASSGAASPGSSVLCATQPPALTGVKDADVKELKTEDKIIGNGAEATTGKQVVMNYIGRLTDGTKFDASCDRSQTFDFNLGGGQVIAGWDQGIVGMKVGGIRRLIIPSSLGYGPGGQGPIPPNAALIFDVELVAVQ
jgi:FKBP-type peptidyl-prolyl cis-trans isomerase